MPGTSPGPVGLACQIVKQQAGLSSEYPHSTGVNPIVQSPYPLDPLARIACTYKPSPQHPPYHTLDHVCKPCAVGGRLSNLGNGCKQPRLPHITSPNKRNEAPESTFVFPLESRAIRVHGRVGAPPCGSWKRTEAPTSAHWGGKYGPKTAEGSPGLGRTTAGEPRGEEFEKEEYGP